MRGGRLLSGWYPAILYLHTPISIHIGTLARFGVPVLLPYLRLTSSYRSGAGPIILAARFLDRRARRLMGKARFAAYRTPFLRNLMLPEYRYWVDPGTLSAMVELITATRDSGAAIVEIGVGRGFTSVFLLEHLRTSRDPRSLLLVDTFSGFTDESIDYELGRRDKSPSDLTDYSYASSKVFEFGLTRLGYSRYRIMGADCTKVDWEAIGPIGALLLDVDLYQPTRETLELVWPLVIPGGGIIVDDCIEPHWADGALQAYTEFIEARGLPFRRVGGRGGLLKKDAV